MAMKMTQRDRVLQYLGEVGYITALDAVRELGITQLAARIVELEKMGYTFNKVRRTGEGRYGKTHWIEYSLRERR